MRPTFRSTLSVQSVLKILAIVVFLGLIVWYSLFQARHFIDGPLITLSAPVPTTTTEDIIVIEGAAENITYLSLNGREIHTDEAGTFQAPLVLENGYTIMTLAAKDRYGRTTSLSRSIVRTQENF